MNSYELGDCGLIQFFVGNMWSVILSKTRMEDTVNVIGIGILLQLTLYLERYRKYEHNHNGGGGGGDRK